MKAKQFYYKALKYYNKIKDQAPELRKVNEITGEYTTIR